VSGQETWQRAHRNASAEPLTSIDTSVPSVARGYDYALGGKNHFEIDRVAAEKLFEAMPGMRSLAQANRAFLRRGVRYLMEAAGIRQIIDVGSGLPTVGNVHEIAHEINPRVRVVYVDHDPIVLAHGRALLADNVNSTVVQADAADPTSILTHPVMREFIAPEYPVAILLSGILHHLTDDQDPVWVTTIFKDAMPSGSYLLVSNFLDDDDPHAREAEAAITAGFGTGRFRTWAAQLPFFDGGNGVARVRLRKRVAARHGDARG
jgi:hypothetical protein